jgi:antitoxin MazE
MRVKTAMWGDSLAVRLPQEVVDALHLSDGEALDVAFNGRSMTLALATRREIPTLAEMVAEMRRLGPENEPETVDWGPDVGSEIIDDEYSRGEIPPPKFLDGD